MDYTITLNADFDKALAAFAKESGSTAEDLLQSVAMGALQSRVEQRRIIEKAIKVDIFEKAAPTATKTDLDAAVAAAIDAENAKGDEVVKGEVIK